MCRATWLQMRDILRSRRAAWQCLVWAQWPRSRSTCWRGTLSFYDWILLLKRVTNHWSRWPKKKLTLLGSDCCFSNCSIMIWLVYINYCLNKWRSGKKVAAETRNIAQITKLNGLSKPVYKPGTICIWKLVMEINIKIRSSTDSPAKNTMKPGLFLEVMQVEMRYECWQ